MPLPTLATLKQNVGITDNSQDSFLKVFYDGIMDLLVEETGLDWNDFGANKVEIFDRLVMCNTVFPIGAWSKIDKVEYKQDSGNWQVLQGSNYELGKMVNRSKIIIEIKQNCCQCYKFTKCTKLRITGTKGIDPFPNALIMFLSELLRGAYNYQSNSGIIVNNEKSQNLSISIDTNSNPLLSIQLYSPQSIPVLNSLIKLYKVNYNYPF